MKLIPVIVSLLCFASAAALAQNAIYPTPRDQRPSTETQDSTTPEAPKPAAVEPIVEVELSENEVIVGQPIRLQIKVLVPTYMPKPPIYPTIELPDLMVRLPDRATTPTSERRDGVSLSGTIRTYRLYPLAVGSFEIPEQVLTLTYADPQTNEPITVEATMPAQSFAASVPAAAQDLNPPVLAEGFAMEQQIEGESSLTVGDAITRTVTARIDGTTPVLIPPLVAAVDAPALRAYPKEPRITATEERGVLSGTRSETVTYLVQSDGDAQLPEIAIEWYNTKTQSLETATVPAVPFTLTPAPPPPPDYRRMALWGGVIVVGLVGLWLVLRRLQPAFKTRWVTIISRLLSTEHAAARTVRKAIANRDLTATYAALDGWRAHGQSLKAEDWTDVQNALVHIGTNTYSESRSDPSTGWQDLAKSFSDLRKTNRNRYLALKNRKILPHMNTNQYIVF